MSDIPEIYFPSIQEALKEEIVEECRKKKYDIVIDKCMPVLHIETFSRYLIMRRKKLKAEHTGITELLSSLDAAFRQVYLILQRCNISKRYMDGLEDHSCIASLIERTVLNMLMTTNCVYYIISAVREEIISVTSNINTSCT